MSQADILSQLARIRRHIHLNKAKFLISYYDDVEETLENSQEKLQLSNSPSANISEIAEQARYYEN